MSYPKFPPFGLLSSPSPLYILFFFFFNFVRKPQKAMVLKMSNVNLAEFQKRETEVKTIES